MEKKVVDLHGQQLIDLLIRRDAEAFKLLYDTYSSSLYGIIIDIVTSKELASEILQQTFFYAWKFILSYDQSKQSLFTWLLHIARSLSVQTLRSNNAWASAAPLAETAGGLRDVLNDMNGDQRQVIALMYYKGLSKAEVAEMLQIPPDMVNTLFDQGMAALYRRLTREDH